MWFGDGPEVCGSLGGFVFPARSSAGAEVLQTTDTVSELLQALADGLASPTETTFGLADVAGAELQGDLSQEKSSGSRDDKERIIYLDIVYAMPLPAPPR